MNTSLSHLLPKKTTLAGIIVACSFLFLLVSPVHAVSSPVAQMELIQQLMEMIIALKAQLETLQAQSTEDSYGSTVPHTCVELSQSLWFGATDATTNGQVGKLQRFLQNTGDFTYGEITGRYGPATVNAVQKWQKRNGIVSYGTPDTTGYGTVGEETIKAMRKGCEAESDEYGSETSVDVTLQDVEVENLDYSVTVTFEFEVTAQGGDVIIPKYTGDIKPLVYDAAGQRLNNEKLDLMSTTLISITEKDDGERYYIDDGSTETFQYIVALSPKETGKYKLEVEQLPFFDEKGEPIVKIHNSDSFTSEYFSFRRLKIQNQPTLSLSVSPSTITVGDGVKLWWNASNANYCSIFGDKDNTSGSVTLYPEQTKTYSVSCVGNTGSTTKSVTVTVNAVSATAPTLILSVSQTSIQSGGSVKLLWSTKNAKYCSLSGGDDKLDVAGTQIIDGIEVTKEYTMTCVGYGGSVTKTVRVDVENVSKENTLCKIADIYGVPVPGYTFNDLYISLNMPVNNYGNYTITGTETWDNLTFKKVENGSANLLLRALENVNSAGVGYIAGKKDVIKVYVDGVLLCPLTTAYKSDDRTDGVSGANMLAGAQSTNSCIDIPMNLHRGKESVAVHTLQKFLVGKGLLSNDDATSFYGDHTIEAVKAYQASHGLPQTGMVYDFTRDAIRKETCTQ